MFKLTILTLLCLSISKSYCGFMDDCTEEEKQMLRNVHDLCVTESGVSNDLLMAANKGDFKPEESLKCYMKCFMSSIGVMDEDGVVDFETYMGLLPVSLKPTGEKIVEKCKGEVGNSPCDTAYKINICSYNVDPSKYGLS